MKELRGLRQQIDKIDSKIVDLLAKRLQLVDKIGEIKLRETAPIKQSEREEEVLKKISSASKKKGLDDQMTQSIFKNIIKHSRRRQKKS